MPNSTQQGDIREFLRINFPHARVVSPTPEQRRRNERRNVGVRTSDPPEALSVTQLVAKIQSLECRLSGALDQINIMKETFKKEMEDQERRIKADTEEKIKKAEEDVDNLRRLLEMNSNQSEVEQHTVGRDGRQHPSPGESNTTVDDGAVNEEVVAPLPPEVTSEVLTSMVRDWRRSDENYWRRSLMISGIGAPGDSDSFRAVRERLRAVGLAFLAEDCVGNYITGRGSIRLSYPMEYDARRYIIRARKTLKETGNRQVHVEYLVPARMVPCKKKLMQFGRRQKSAGVISSYDVMVKNNQPVLRTFKHGTGVVYVKVNDIEQQDQQNNSQMEI